MRLLQVLTRHNYSVTSVKWCSHNPYHNLLTPLSLILASSDKSGRVIVWDVSSTAVYGDTNVEKLSVVTLVTPTIIDHEVYPSSLVRQHRAVL